MDSSVTAHLLLEAGYKVSGIHLELTPPAELGAEADHEDLEATCRKLDIPLHYLHLETEFESQVISYFCEEYRRGRTPNPCIQCNKVIKFGLLLEKVSEMGGKYLATGHYARITQDESGYSLLKGVDPAKDQSYFLYRLGQKELSRVLFPLGEKFKKEVKVLAASLEIPASRKPESQDICFIPGNDSREFLSNRLKTVPGEITDTEGNILGRHEGLAYYTIGQRQGIKVSARERLYVIRIDAETNRLIVGTESQLFKDRLIAYNLNWISGRISQTSVEVTAKVRYRTPEVKATVLVKGTEAEVRFAEPQKGVAPGQSIVFYDSDKVLGGGIIGETN